MFAAGSHGLAPSSSSCVLLFVLFLVIGIMHLLSTLLTVCICFKMNCMYLSLDAAFDVGNVYKIRVYVHTGQSKGLGAVLGGKSTGTPFDQGSSF